MVLVILVGCVLGMLLRASEFGVCRFISSGGVPMMRMDRTSQQAMDMQFTRDPCRGHDLPQVGRLSASTGTTSTQEKELTKRTASTKGLFQFVYSRSVWLDAEPLQLCNHAKLWLDRTSFERSLTHMSRAKCMDLSPKRDLSKLMSLFLFASSCFSFPTLSCYK